MFLGRDMMNTIELCMYVYLTFGEAFYFVLRCKINIVVVILYINLITK